jgi:SecD/SecF fusion protein
VRENTPLLRKNSFAQIVNVSIWETLTRSLNTSLITLFPIATLLVFGGATLKDFAFALLIGIASGAYSSIFIAAPLLSLWKGHEAEYRRRQDTGIEKATLGTVAPGMAGGTGGGAATAPATMPVRKKAENLSEGVPVPELSDEELAAREAARRRREERRRKQGRGHGRRT